MKELEKSYEPAQIEPKLRKEWEEKNLFEVTEPISSDFSIAFPPPNVTGELHMGHALNSTLQDVLIRYNRMLGKKVHWQIGCDHAGIGTQIVVEKQLAKNNQTKYDLGREAFEKETWKWTEQHLGKIENQMKLLGLSPDWSKSKFTLDSGYVSAVRKHFYELFKQGLIRRGTRLINWCPHCLTSLSDLEVVHEDRKGKLYKISYKLEEPIGDLTELVVATSRPETLFGDVAVAINPNDEKYKPLIDSINSGKEVLVKLPLTDKTIPIILSEAVETDFGTGALKITPAHDFNDEQISKDWNNKAKPGEAQLEQINIFSESAKLLPLDFVSSELHNLERFALRDKTLELLEKQELLVGEEKYSQAAALHDRCGNVIEPYLSPQWFVYMKPLAKIAIEKLKNEEVNFHPQRYSKTYLDWLENIQDWCISRQIWWGHKIPVWSKKIENLEASTSEESEELHVELMNEIKKISKELGYFLEIQGDKKRPSFIVAKKANNEFIFERGTDEVQIVVLNEDKSLESELLKIGYEQETDVLDTWFSSALWPFATLDWPQKNLLEPKRSWKKSWTSVLITAREIINLWVSRMIYSSVNLTGALPFTDILIHPVIQTPDGKRMSKSKGNAINPIDLIDKYGADATRLWYCSVGIFSSQDTRFPGKKEKDKDGKTVWTSQTIEDKRKFINKLWNATKFVIQNISTEKDSSQKPLNPNSHLSGRGLALSFPCQGEGAPMKIRGTDGVKKLSSEELLLELKNTDGSTSSNTANIWIVNLLNKTIADANEHLKNYRFGEYIACLENFFWYEFCDWYLELAKISLNNNEAKEKTKEIYLTQSTLYLVLENILRAFNPVIPFASEELWRALTGEDENLAFQGYPSATVKVNEIEEDENSLTTNNLKTFANNIRSVRQKIFGLPPSEKISFAVSVSEEVEAKDAYKNFSLLLDKCKLFLRIEKLEEKSSEEQLFKKTLSFDLENQKQIVNLQVAIPAQVNLAERKDILQKDFDKKQKEKSQGENRLNNAGFMQNASEEVKNELKANIAVLSQETSELAEALEQISQLTNSRDKAKI